MTSAWFISSGAEFSIPNYPAITPPNFEGTLLASLLKFLAQWPRHIEAVDLIITRTSFCVWKSILQLSVICSFWCLWPWFPSHSSQCIPEFFNEHHIQIEEGRNISPYKSNSTILPKTKHRGDGYTWPSFDSLDMLVLIVCLAGKGTYLFWILPWCRCHRDLITLIELQWFVLEWMRDCELISREYARMVLYTEIWTMKWSKSVFH